MCVRLAYPWVNPGVWRFFFTGQPWVIICTRSSWTKKKATHRGRPGEAKRTHPL